MVPARRIRAEGRPRDRRSRRPGDGGGRLPDRAGGPGSAAEVRELVRRRCEGRAGDLDLERAEPAATPPGGVPAVPRAERLLRQDSAAHVRVLEGGGREPPAVGRRVQRRSGPGAAIPGGPRMGLAPGRGGRVIQFTVPMGLGSGRYQTYANNSWFYLVLVNEAVRVLIGDTEDQVFNFAAGQNVILKWPPGDFKPGASYFLSGPDVSATDSVVRREEGQPFFRWGPEKTTAAGNFTLQSEDGKWIDGFGVNVPVEESNLERLPPDPITELFGPATLFPADKKLTLTSILSGKFTQPIELFPFLMILLLLVLAVENWMGNRFYRKKRAAG